MIDDGHRLRIGPVLIGEVASGQQRRAHRLQIIRSDNPAIHLDVFVQPRHIALRQDTIGMDGETQRRKIRQSCGLNPRQLLQARQQLTVKLNSRLVRVAHRSEIEVNQQHMARIESRIGLLRFLKAADEQARARQQQQRQGDLRHHESRGEPRLVQPARRIERLVLEDAAGREFRCAQRRHGPGDQRGQQGDQHRRQHHPAIDAAVDGQRQGTAGKEQGEGLRRPKRDRQRN